MALDNALDNTHVVSIQTKVQINEEDSSQKRVLDKFSADSGKMNNNFNSMNRKSWKEDCNLLHGTASNDAQSTALSADVYLVGYKRGKTCDISHAVLIFSRKRVKRL